jgi:hypothetical protein
MVDEIFYGGKPCFYKAIQNIKYVGDAILQASANYHSTTSQRYISQKDPTKPNHTCNTNS